MTPQWLMNLYDEIRKLPYPMKGGCNGEIGLDFYRDRSPRDVQESVFDVFCSWPMELDNR
jgi:Tat protein secretion system quality control protein TatD with DNase activity